MPAAAASTDTMGTTIVTMSLELCWSKTRLAAVDAPGAHAMTKDFSDFSLTYLKISVSSFSAQSWKDVSLINYLPPLCVCDGWICEDMCSSVTID